MIEETCTKIAALVGGLSLFEHLIEVFLELSVPFDQLVYEHDPKTHSQRVLPRI